jgi:hypothetical protein
MFGAKLLNLIWSLNHESRGLTKKKINLTKINLIDILINQLG